MTTQQIIQYNLPPKTGEHKIALPQDADIFCVRERGNAIGVWAMVNSPARSDDGVVERTFWVAHNGDHLPAEQYPGKKKTYLGTAIVGDLPMHVWQVGE